MQISGALCSCADLAAGEMDEILCYLIFCEANESANVKTVFSFDF